jgi:hypothetical protein
VATVHVPGAENGGDYAGGHLLVNYVLSLLTDQCRLYVTGTGTFQGNGTWRISSWIHPPGDLTNACEGPVSLQVNVTGNADDKTTNLHTNLTAKVHMQRAARYVSLNASPEPVRKGGTVTTKATIQRASWDDHKYHAYSGQKSELQFRTSTGVYSDVKKVRAASGGHLKASAKQTKAGCWRYTFAGTTATGPATAPGDCVAVTH